jgi:hypothetical protein
MADFTQQMGNMSMSEMQLLYEVGVPYFCHDLPSFGVPQIVVVMWLLLRHAMIIFTRMPEAAGKAEYKQLLYEGRAALFAYAATAEHYHSQVENGVSQFKFTWKLHVSVAHLAHMMQDSGHAVQANDTWVERMMRHKASRSIKCVAYLLCFAICYSHTLLLPLHDTLYTCVLMQDLCRDRATANTEDAIMNAHQDNHSGKAMEVVLAHAQQQGAVFLPALPLIPTLQDIKGMSREARAQEAGTSTKRRRAIWDDREADEHTSFLGNGSAMRNGTTEATTIYNAVGFFMYTQCRANPSGEWPAVLCARLHLLTVA